MAAIRGPSPSEEGEIVVGIYGGVRKCYFSGVFIAMRGSTGAPRSGGGSSRKGMWPTSLTPFGAVDLSHTIQTHRLTMGAPLGESPLGTLEEGRRGGG